MINTKQTDIKSVMKTGEDVKKAINLHYKEVEIDIDGVFKVLGSCR